MKRIETLYLKQLAVTDTNESEINEEETINQSNTFDEEQFESSRKENLFAEL